MAVHARLAGILLTEQTMDTALQLITSLARDTIAGSMGSGITLLTRDGKPATSASTDPLVDTLDLLQYGLDEGPCLTAWATSSVIRSDDLSAEERWPIWSPQAARHGMRSVLSSSMDIAGTTWGAIKVYSTRPPTTRRPQTYWADSPLRLPSSSAMCTPHNRSNGSARTRRKCCASGPPSRRPRA